MPNDIVAFEQRLESEKDSILARLPKVNEWLTPERWYSITRDLIKREQFRPVIQQNPDSLIDAIKDLAVWGVEADGQEAFINVRTIDNRKTAMAQIMWKGLVRRGRDTGVIAHAVADVIREGDTIEEVVDHKGRHLKHVRAFNAAPNRKIVGSYALFWMSNGLMDYELLDADDIAVCFRASQRAAGGKTTPAWQNTPGEQAKKSAINRGMKRMRGMGKRDPSYDAMMEAQQRQFDAETTATTETGELQDDERPLPQPNSATSPQSEVCSPFTSESGTAAAADVEDAEGNSIDPGVDSMEGRVQETDSGAKREKSTGAAPAPDRLIDDNEATLLRELMKGKPGLAVINAIKRIAPETGGHLRKLQLSQFDAIASAIQAIS